MEHYVKGEENVIECGSAFPADLTENVTNMRIKEGTKVKNIVAFVRKMFMEDASRRVIFSGSDSACARVISCVEVFKRQYKDTLYQSNVVVFRRTEEFWEPQIEGLDRLKVNRDTPAIFILLSKDPLDELSHKSYQLSTDLLPTFPARPDAPTSMKRKSSRPSGNEKNKWRKPPKTKP